MAAQAAERFRSGTSLVAELTSRELTADLIAWSRDEPYPDRGEHPVWRWERWIGDDPERAWLVFEELVRHAPDDVEVIERVSQRLEQLVFRHRPDFLERAIRLVLSTPLLDRMVGPELFTEGHYGPRYRDLDELATVWVRHDAHSDASHRVTDIIRSDAELGLTLALTIMHRVHRTDSMSGTFTRPFSSSFVAMDRPSSTRLKWRP